MIDNNKNEHDTDIFTIVLTKDGEEMKIEYPQGGKDEIASFFYIQPTDKRCDESLFHEVNEIQKILRPVIGSTPTRLSWLHRDKTAVKLHEAAILGYIESDVVDPRMNNKVATSWEVFFDKRIFKSEQKLARLIVEKEKPQVAETIKEALLQESWRCKE